MKSFYNLKFKKFLYDVLNYTNAFIICYFYLRPIDSID